MPVQIKKSGDKIETVTPFNADFVKKAKALNARWNGDAWEFDARDEERVRELCLSIYGTDGSPCELVDVQITASAFLTDGEIMAFGRTLARRMYRDSRPRLGEGVIVAEGQFASRGGSQKNPKIETGEVRGMVLEVRDVPLAAIENERHSGDIAIVRRHDASEPRTADREAPLSERLATIATELRQLNRAEMIPNGLDPEALAAELNNLAQIAVGLEEAERAEKREKLDWMSTAARLAKTAEVPSTTRKELRADPSIDDDDAEVVVYAGKGAPGDADGPVWAGSIEDVVEANSDYAEEILALGAGESCLIGGGAAPVFEVSRIK